jgi:hypothetical protein
MSDIDVRMKIELRTPEEIQAAHDRIVAILTGQVPNPFGFQHLPTLQASVDVLCWILKHEHNLSFGKNLAAMDEWLRGQGIEIVDCGYLQVPPET